MATALARIAESPRVVFALDFDGTLAPLGDDPARSAAIPESAALLPALDALPGVTLALVSGRARASLAAVSAAPENAVLIGSHGAEGLAADDAHLNAEETARREHIFAVLQSLIAECDDLFFEPKPFGAAFHVRRAPVERRSEFVAAAIARLSTPDVYMTQGKDVVEFAVRKTNKGEALSALRAHFSADSVVFFGDDVTDEHGFEVLGEHDLGVKIGAGETLAAERLDSLHDVPAVLAAFIHAREQRVS
ncbi:trehalose-phosphatase [Humidisolicoccus flavus]|uniref:trehalose-phosphatase n=1 Tax=Humidisolicoccus flavus TaxID=3111414 RepID=UPI00324BF77A